MNIKQMWGAAVTFIRKLPVAKYIKPVWKAGLKLLVAEGGDELQAAAQKYLAGPRAEQALKDFDKAFDAFQAKLRRGVQALPLPAGIEDAALELIQERGDELQGAARGAIAAGSRQALDQAFDAFQAQLSERIGAL